MISLNNSEKLLEIGSNIASPFEYQDTLLIACSNGEVLKFSDGQLKPEFKINGQATCITYDTDRQIFYVGDAANKAIYAYATTDQQPSQLVKEYEGVPLLGPHSILLSKKTGNLIFTDCGRFDQPQSSHNKQVPIQIRQGSVFMIDMQQQDIKPFALRCLETPTGLAFGQTQQVFYVCQTGKNRVLRFFENSDGVIYPSVFYQFSGRFGPTAIAASNTGTIFVGAYEFRSLSSQGLVSVLSSSGELLSKLKLNHTGPEISGLFFSRTSNNNAMLYMTENSAKPSCFRLLIQIAKKQQKKQELSYRELLR